MKNGSSLSGPLTSICHWSFFIGHLAEKSLPWLRSIFALVVQMNTDLCLSVFICGFLLHWSLDNAFGLIDHNDSIHARDVVLCAPAVGPAHFEPLDLGRGSEPEVHAQIRLRHVTSTAGNIGAPAHASSRAKHNRADGIARAFLPHISHQPYGQPVARTISPVVAEQ